MAAAETRCLADTVLMVRPLAFGFNNQTAADNPFQTLPLDGVSTETALREFDDAVHDLRNAGIKVLVLDKHTEVPAPDAVFPNNWISTDANGSVYLYPMFAPIRRAERNRYPEVEDQFRRAGFDVRNVVDIGPADADRRFLEGTGSMCLDRARRIIYAGLSLRTHVEPLEHFRQVAGYDKAVTFHTRGSGGVEFYHTNVMMSVGERFAVVCPDCIPDNVERNTVLTELRAHGEVIEITLEQTEKNYCGNIIQLQSRHGHPVIAMSRRARAGFTPAQWDRLQAHGEILELKIDHIEEVGGGSARCMMAEVFLPRAAM